MNAVEIEDEVAIKDRFGQPMIPREWFLVPLFVINEAVDRIKDGTITAYKYDPKALRWSASNDGRLNSAEYGSSWAYTAAL